VLALMSAIFSRRKTVDWKVAHPGDAGGRWQDERRGMIANSEALFQQLDEEEGESAGQQWWRD